MGADNDSEEIFPTKKKDVVVYKFGLVLKASYHIFRMMSEMTLIIMM